MEETLKEILRKLDELQKEVARLKIMVAENGSAIKANFSLLEQRISNKLIDLNDEIIETVSGR